MVTSELFSDKVLACLKAPCAEDNSTLEQSGESLSCAASGQTYPYIKQIPSLYAPAPWEATDVTDKVQSFYEQHPFPNYEGLEAFGELVRKGHENPFSSNLLTAIGGFAR